MNDSSAQTRSLTIRIASQSDLAAIREIYNQGIDDRIATLETEARSASDIAAWFAEHDPRYAVIIVEEGDALAGWASLNRFSSRYAHDAIADLSVYVRRECRGHGLGLQLLRELERLARTKKFHKLVLHALDANAPGQKLYRKAGFLEVGIFREHGILDGGYVDVIAMEKIL